MTFLREGNRSRRSPGAARESVQARRTAGRWRHGRRVPRVRRVPAARRRRQAARRVTWARSRSASAFRRRGTRGRGRSRIRGSSRCTTWGPKATCSSSSWSACRERRSPTNSAAPVRCRSTARSRCSPTCSTASGPRTCGVLHRDIKPSNVLIDSDGRAKVADFGIATTAGGDLTKTGTVIGSAAYLAPERVDGRRATERSDLYAVGVVAYEALTGRRPFSGGTPIALGARNP